jgi:hypothetical protein
MSLFVFTIWLVTMCVLGIIVYLYHNEGKRQAKKPANRLRPVDLLALSPEAAKWLEEPDCPFYGQIAKASFEQHLWSSIFYVPNMPAQRLYLDLSVRIAGTGSHSVNARAVPHGVIGRTYEVRRTCATGATVGEFTVGADKTTLSIPKKTSDVGEEWLSRELANSEGGVLMLKLTQLAGAACQAAELLRCRSVAGLIGVECRWAPDADGNVQPVEG